MEGHYQHYEVLNSRGVLQALDRESSTKLYDDIAPLSVTMTPISLDPETSYNNAVPELKPVATIDGFSGATSSSAAYNLATAIVGSSIMSLPATLRLLGLPLALVLLVFSAYVTQVSVEMLLKTTVTQHVWSYSDLVKQVHGEKARIALDVSVVLLNFSLCVVHFIIIGDVLCGGWSGSLHYNEGILVEWNGGETAWWTARPFVVLVTTLVFILPLVFLKHVDSLHYSSALSMALAMTFVLIILVLCLIQASKGALHTPSWHPDFSSLTAVMSVFAAIPVVATAFVCQFSIHPIFSELKDRSEKNMFTISRLCVLFAITLYLLSSVAGYLLFGAETAMDVLVNFNDNWGGTHLSRAANTVARIAYALHIVFVFPVVFYPLRQITDDLLFGHSARPLLEDGRRFAILTGVGVSLVYVLAVVVPNIWIAYNLVGSSATMVVGFIFPGTIALADRSGVIGKGERWAAYFFLVFSAVIAITSVASSLYFLITGASEGE